jgi:hypothetical protein
LALALISFRYPLEIFVKILIFLELLLWVRVCSLNQGACMFRAVTTQSISAVTAAALVGSFAAFLTPIVPDARADARIGFAALHGAHAKADRLPARVTGSRCSSQSWPGYDVACQFDLRRPADGVRQVRVVSLIRDKVRAAQ